MEQLRLVSGKDAQIEELTKRLASMPKAPETGEAGGWCASYSTSPCASKKRLGIVVISLKRNYKI